MMNAKGSLELSIQTIVIIVIAFVVLGLGLSLTTNIFKGLQDEIPGVFSVLDLDTKPTTDNPITLSEIIEINRKKTKTMKVGFYNRGDGTAVNVVLTIKQCLKAGNELVAFDTLPTLTSISTNVPVSEGKGYSVIFSENGLPAGQYICEIAAKCEKDCPDWLDTEFYEIKQFVLKVIA